MKPLPLTQLDSLRSQIEALLFTAGRPLTARQLARLTNVPPKAAEAAVQELINEYAQTNRGITVMQQDDKVQMVTNPKHGAVVEQFVKEEFTGPLSRAALETLAIIAYRGPVPKPQIDAVRGVNSAIMLRTLLIRGLVERRRSRSDARTFEYTLSFDFVRHLGIGSAGELPDFAELSKNAVMERFAKAEASASMTESSTTSASSSSASSNEKPHA